jgi:subtilase family serine protease
VTSTWIVRRLAVAACLFGSWSLVSAQAVRSRIAEDINPNNTVVLRGTVSPRIARPLQIGRMAPSTPVDGITLTFALTPEQKAELDALIQAQQTPGNPEYHQWLTPAEYAARFGMSQADLDKVQQWLQSEGFNVERVANSRTSITFSGTVEQVETAFQTQMNRYRVNGEEHWANGTDLSIPAALQGVVLSVGNLNDFRPHSMMHPVVKPAYTSSQSGTNFMTPGDVATIYDVTAAYQAGYDGTGVTIAIMGQSAVQVSDIEAFESAAGLPKKDPALILVPNSGASTAVAGDESESDLDLEYSGATAKGATVDFVYVGNNQNYSVFDSAQYAVDNQIGSVISLSYGACETGITQAQFNQLEQIMQQGASQGQTVVASAGDSGSTSCYGYTNLTSTQQQALAVNYPASSDYAVGVGGTEFQAADVNAGTGTGSNSSQYWNSSNASNGSSAIQYVPETTWNDDPACGKYAAQNNQPGAALCAGGGGVSALALRPSWQTGVPGIASGTMRLVPDVSLDSSNVTAPYLYCTSDTSSWSGGQKASCNSGFRDSTSQDLTAAGGTSFAAPIFAGMMAIIDQKTDGNQGPAATELYKLAGNAATYGAAFHDTTSGGNQCTAGSAYCSSAGQGSYAAGTGYDEATGLGSVDFNALMTAWNSATTLDASTTTEAAANSTVTAGSSDNITITVASQSSGVSGTPTGTLTIIVDGTTETSSLALTNGSATYAYTTTSTTLNGPHSIEAIYSGDSKFSDSSATIAVTVTGGASPASFLLSASPTTISVKSGSSATTTVTITSQNSYAGTVNFSLSTTSTALQDDGCAAINNTAVTANGTATATLTLYTSSTSCVQTGLRTAPGALVRFGHGGGTAHNRSPFIPALPIGASALAGVLLFGFRRQRSKLGAMLGCLMLAMALGGFVSGCGGSSGTGTGNSNNVPPGSYAITLTGTDSANSSVTTSVNLTLNVT